MTEREAYIAFNMIPTVGAVAVARLAREAAGSVADAYACFPQRRDWDGKEPDWEGEMARAARMRVRIVALCDADYPPQLREIASPPLALYVVGAVEALSRAAVALVGTRAATAYGRDEKVDTLIIGGGMAYTFEKAQGGKIGGSLLEEDKMDYALEMIEKAKAKGVKLLLPVDHVVGKEFSNDTERKTIAGDIDDEWSGFDIGPKTIELFSEALKGAKTVVWNGPMGVFENPILAKGTIAVAQALADTDATTIIGGGDSAAAVNQLGFADKMTHISTGGGASLEFLEGKDLPGVVAANDK